VRLSFRGLSYLCFGPGMNAVGAAVRGQGTGGFGLIIEGAALKANPHYPAILLGRLAVQMLNDAGLPEDFAHLRDLPLARQRILVATCRVLMGRPAEVRLAHLLNPSARAWLAQMEAERKAHVVAVAEAKTRGAESATREANREAVRSATLSDAERTAILDRIAVPGIHLRRVWPMRRAAAHPGHSWIGGRPGLPAGIEWPRGPVTGLPLHFLAQIDCAELPKSPGPARRRSAVVLCRHRRGDADRRPSRLGGDPRSRQPGHRHRTRAAARPARDRP
jgi:hypothetical protein